MNKKITNVLELIDYLEQTARSSGNILGKVSFNKNELIKLIAEVKENLPEEFVEATSIVKSADEIILNARKEAAIIEEEAKRAVKREYENSKILKAAQKEANEILEKANMKAREIKTEANKYSKEMRASAINYVDTTLSKLQKEIDVKSESLIIKVNKEMDTVLRGVYEDFSNTTSTIRENIKDLASMK